MVSGLFIIPCSLFSEQLIYREKIENDIVKSKN